MFLNVCIFSKQPREVSIRVSIVGDKQMGNQYNRVTRLEPYMQISPAAKARLFLTLLLNMPSVCYSSAISFLTLQRPLQRLCFSGEGQLENLASGERSSVNRRQICV